MRDAHGDIKKHGFSRFRHTITVLFLYKSRKCDNGKKNGEATGPIRRVQIFGCLSLSLIYNLCCGRAIIEDLLTVALLQCTPRFLHMASTLVWRRFEYNMRRTSNIFALSYPVSLQLPSIRRLHIFIPSFSQKSINKRSSGVDVVAAIASLCCTHF